MCNNGKRVVRKGKLSSINDILLQHIGRYCVIVVKFVKGKISALL